MPDETTEIICRSCVFGNCRTHPGDTYRYPSEPPTGTDPLEPPVDELTRLRTALTATERERDELLEETDRLARVSQERDDARGALHIALRDRDQLAVEAARLRANLTNTIRREYYDRLMDQRSALDLMTAIGYNTTEARDILASNQPVEVKDIARLGSSCRAREGEGEPCSDNPSRYTISVIMMYPLFDHGSRYESLVKGLIREPAYEAARSVIRRFPASAKQNGRLWRAVEAALDAMGIPAGAVDGTAAPTQQ